MCVCLYITPFAYFSKQNIFTHYVKIIVDMIHGTRKIGTSTNGMEPEMTEYEYFNQLEKNTIGYGHAFGEYVATAFLPENGYGWAEERLLGKSFAVWVANAINEIKDDAELGVVVRRLAVTAVSQAADFYANNRSGNDDDKPWFLKQQAL